MKEERFKLKMEEIFSSKSTIEKKLDVDTNNNRLALTTETELDAYFDVSQVVTWVGNNTYKRVALQFPDELLYCSIRVIDRLRRLSPGDVQFFLLADTSYGK